MRNIIHYLNTTLPVLGYAGRIRIHPLPGGGSDRRIFRVCCGPRSYILAHHPGGRVGAPSENESYYRLGNHLRSKGFPVPEIYGYQPDRGQFLLEDFGDRSLEGYVRGKSKRAVRETYGKLVALLARLQIAGADGFSPDWCNDTPLYDGAFSRERETLYFIKAFMGGVRGREVDGATLREFAAVARRVDGEPLRLFLYRDFQSRNVLIRGKGFGLIDFQGGRLGPPQYDLASLLIDPYAGLPPDLQEELLGIYFRNLSEQLSPLRGAGKRERETDWPRFMENYRVIGFQRNLQMLGAFGHLTRVKGKSLFARSIPPAVQNLKRWVTYREFKPYRRLRKLVAEL